MPRGRPPKKSALSTVPEKRTPTENRITMLLKSAYNQITAVLLAHPERSFFTVLGTLFFLIIIGSIIGRPEEDKSVSGVTPKEVNVFAIGAAPKISLTGKTEKTGVVKITAQTSGIVQKILVSEGQQINRGAQIITLSTNYQGGTLQQATRQIAEKSYAFTESNYETQKDMIVKRRQIAEAAGQQSEDLREIARTSFDDTDSLIKLNESILETLDDQISYLETTNTGSANDSLILQAKQGKAGVQSGLLSLRSALRSSQYQADDEKNPAQLSQLSKDLTLKQLELEEKSLELNKEISRLNLTVARITESLMYPATPVSGTVERIFVKGGQSVNPGTVIATVTGKSNSAVIIATVPKDLAGRISRLEPSTLIVNQKTVELIPRYISTEPTDGELNTVHYTLPDELADALGNGSTVKISIPIDSAKSSGSIHFVPLDALYQTGPDAYLFIASQSAENTIQTAAGSGVVYTAVSRKVTLGTVMGQYVEVTEGLKNQDLVILDRSVINEDQVVLVR